MMRVSRFRPLRAVGVIAVALLPLLGAAAWGQTPPQSPSQPRPQFRHGGGVAGMVASVSSGSFVGTTRRGGSVTVRLTGATRVLGRRSAALTDFHAGDTMLVVADRAANGSATARAVTDTAAAAAPGAPNGRGGLWSGRNGRVVIMGRLAAAPEGGVLSVALPVGVPLTVAVPSSARLSRLVLLPAGSVAVGARVFVRGTPNPDHTITATTIVEAGAPRR